MPTSRSRALTPFPSAGSPLVRRDTRRTERAAAAGMASDRVGRPHANPRAHGHRQDTGRLPLGTEPTDRARARGAAAECGADPLHLAAQGAQQRHSAQPRAAVGRAHRRFAETGNGVPGDTRRRAHRRHAGLGPRADAPSGAAHPHHHARVAAHHAHHRARPRHVRAGACGDRGRDPRRGREQARRASRADARATGRALRDAPAAHRAFGHAAAAG